MTDDDRIEALFEAISDCALFKLQARGQFVRPELQQFYEDRKKLAVHLLKELLCPFEVK